MQICVVTKVPDPEKENGNLCAPIIHRLPPALTVSVMFTGRVEVFTLGEIFILGPGGREYGGKGRKPSKWDIEFETCQTLEQAVELSEKVTREQ